MGVCIYLNVSKSVTQSEWEPVYEETLKMLEPLGLASLVTKTIHGERIKCLEPTREKTFHRWNGEEVGWCADGDYLTLNYAEDNGLRRVLAEGEDSGPDDGDPMLDILNAGPGAIRRSYCLWGGKTQGLTMYHLGLLAIACMITTRLGDRAYVCGDITKGQCEKAVELATDALGEPVDVPCQCDLQRLFDRVEKLPLTPDEKLEAFEREYLGSKNAEFGEFIRAHFDREVLDRYWEKRLRRYVGRTDIYDYLLFGFDLGDLCGYVKDGKEEEFVRELLYTGIYVEEKSESLRWGIDPEEWRPYGIGSIFVGWLASNRQAENIERYIPLDKIRTVLEEKLGSRLDVSGAIDAYLMEKASENPADSRTVLDDFQDMVKRTDAKFDTYDVSAVEQLFYYERGNTLSPDMWGIARAVGGFFREIWASESFHEVAKMDVDGQFSELVVFCQ